MVLVEEIIEEETMAQPSAAAAAGAAASAPKAPATKLASGFLDSAKTPLYGPEGSSEGKVASETHKAHAEHKMNEDVNAGMNRGAKENNGHERPSWYTKEWPKDCQYNSPGCTLEALATSSHASAVHREMVRKGPRWQEAFAPGVATMRLSFGQITDEDLTEILQHLKGNEDVTELDLSHNKIKDAGIQALVASLAGGAAPKLKDLRIYSNEFGDLGRTMLTQGMPVFRKKLVVHWQEPDWAVLKEFKGPPKAASPEEPTAAAEVTAVAV